MEGSGRGGLSLGVRVKEEPECTDTDHVIKEERHVEAVLVEIKCESSADSCVSETGADPYVTHAIKDEVMEPEETQLNMANSFRMIKEERHVEAVLVEIKCESSADSCVSETGADLYVNHAIKDEVVMGPEQTQLNMANSFRRETPREVVASSAEHKTVQQYTFDTLQHTETNYECDDCGKMFTQKRLLIRHINTHRKKELPKSNSTRSAKYPCRVCKKEFQKDYLKIHERSHTGEKYGCEVCNKKFVFLVSLKQHQRIHTGEKPYACDICKKSFAQSWYLKTHKRSHTGEKPYVCGICKTGFTQKNHLEAHTRSHTGEKPYACEVCKKQFAVLGSLREHKRIHTKEKPYGCDICNKSFAKSNHLKIHRRSHTGDKPYVCEVCNRGFTQMGNLQSHRRVHTGEKPYSCTICNKLFAARTAFNNHKKTHTERL